MEKGSATLPINLVSPPTTISPMLEPQPRVLPNWGGHADVATGSEPVFASHQRIQSPMVVHESPHYTVVDESAPPPPQPNTVGPVSPPPSPGPRQAAYIERVHGILHLIQPSRVGVWGGSIPLGGGRLRLLLRAPHPCPALRGGPLVPPWQGGLLRRLWWIISSSWWGESLVSTFWGPRSNTGGN